MTELSDRIQGRYNLHLIREAIRSGLTDADDINDFTTWFEGTTAGRRAHVAITIEETYRDVVAEFKRPVSALLARLPRRRST